MAFFYPLDSLFSRNSRRSRHRSYTVPSIVGGGPNPNDSIKQVYRVHPGVVINFVEPAPSRANGWGPPRVEHGPSRLKFPGDFNKDTSWMHAHSPHPRVMKLDDEDYNIPAGLDFHPDPRRSPRRPFAPILDEHPDSHYAMPFPPPPFYDEPDSMPDMFFESDDSSQHVPSPTDLPTPNSPSASERSFHSLSSSDDLPTLHKGYPISDIGSHFFDARRSPSPIDPPGLRDPPFHSHSRRPSFSGSSRSSMNVRTVRFNENPVLPDPIPRRKGWWNRRGDQLWNNDGSYRPAPEHDLYPPDLRNYPEPGVGWMNEEGITIDPKRRLVRRKPLKPALKKASTY